MAIKFVCDRCGAENGRGLSLYEQYPARSYDFCEQCAEDFEVFMNNE